MAGAETWTAARDWSAGETVTDTIMNTHVRDNLTYLKGVLTGSDLQNLAVHANKLLTQGGMRVHRHPQANNRHIESGNFDFGDLAATSDEVTAVTFTDAYASAPNVVGTCIASSIPRDVLVTCTDILTTGFNLRVHNQAGGSLTGVQAAWIAEGQD